jgi:O-antigen/teichoic acid export membrane protein
MAFGMLSFAVMLVIGLGGAVAIARVYGVRTIGEFALAYAPTGTVWWLSSVKEQAALVRELAALPPRAPRITGLTAAVFSFSSALTFFASILGAIGCIIAFNGPIDRPDLIAPACVTLACYVLFINPGWNLDTVFSAFVAGRELFWIRLHQTLANLVLGLGLGLAWDSVWGLVAAFGISGATSLLHRVIAVRRFMALRASRQEIRDGFRALPGIIRFGLKITPGMIFQGVSNEIATWTLGVFGTVTMVGAYNRAWTLGRKMQELNWRIAEMLLPTLVVRWAEGDRTGFDRALFATLRYAAILMLLIAAAGGGSAHGIMELFGSGFSQADTALAMIMFMPALVTLSTLLSQALVAQDRPTATSVAAGGRMVATVVLTVALVPPLGLTGAGLGMLLGAATDLLIKAIFLLSSLTTPIRSLWPARQLAGVLMATTAGFALSDWVDDLSSGLLGLAAAVIGGSLTYIAVLLAVGGFDSADIQRYLSVRDSVRQRLMRSPSAGVSELV